MISDSNRYNKFSIVTHRLFRAKQLGATDVTIVGV